MLTDSDRRARAAVYDAARSLGRPPSARWLGERLGVPTAAVRASLERLAVAKVLVLQADSREILMANPFSAVPTPFAVHASRRSYYGNCVWDALGILAALHTDGRVEASCGSCGEAMELVVVSGQLAPTAGVVHFAVPARRWWKDVVHT